ncbi:hypothetical protein ATEIFO6365_0006001500 [Aspergillus terreus]|uniref:SnoaL-like domain-containing protein n=1 Tax=Aspergillus terreus TaxID=33178 RepID=A0A5M3YZK7_ASPTE|nr:hypothetical protein ATETN484_0005001300 [Aspergillus terreus]GFF16680.1 hypothetical protein ATEIFO6365_0006001500 [Aspergillus terreus]
MPTETIPGTNRPAVFKLPDPGSLGLDQEPPTASGRQVYNTDDASTLERFKIRELSEGWPIHRDACEWTDLRAIFDPRAFLNICWLQLYRDDAINKWANGWKNGEYIMHRVLGHAVEIKGDRAINKMKVTISWRFSDEDGVEWDCDCDVRFVLFFGKQPQGWQIFCNHPIYEKDKIVPVNPSRIPKIDPEAVAKEPKGYRYLAYSIRRLGYPIKTNLPQLYGRERDLVYQEMVDWLDGKEIDFSADEF